MSLWDGYKNVSGYNMMHSFLHPEEGYEEGDKQLQQSWDEAKGYEQPFQQAGVNEIDRLHDATGRLLSPEELQNQWAKGYETSPYAKDELARSQTQGLDAASAMGLSGSSAGLENIQRTGSSIVNADRQRYLDDLMKKYQLGVESSQNIFGKGADVGMNMGEGAMRTGENRAQMKYGARNAPGQLFGQLAGTAIGAYTGVPNNMGGGQKDQYRPWQPGGR